MNFYRRIDVSRLSLLSKHPDNHEPEPTLSLPPLEGKKHIFQMVNITLREKQSSYLCVTKATKHDIPLQREPIRRQRPVSALGH